MPLKKEIGARKETKAKENMAEPRKTKDISLEPNHETQKANDKTNPWDVLLYPHIAEKSMSMVDLQNKLVFVVSLKSTKGEIKNAFEKLFEVKVDEVKTERTIEGTKKAFIKLAQNYSAADIATRLGVL